MTDARYAWTGAEGRATAPPVPENFIEQGYRRASGDHRRPSQMRASSVTIPSVFLPLHRRQRASRNPNNAPALNQFQMQRRKFVIKVNTLALIFISITTIQWLLTITVPFFENVFKTNNVITLFAMLSTFMLLSIFICIDQIRYNTPCNIMFALLIVECATFGLMRALLHSTVGQFIFSIIVSAILFFTFIYIGDVLPRDLTMDVLILNLASFVFYFLITLLIVMVLLTDAYFPDTVFVIMLMVMLMVYVMYNWQIISGTRVGALRWNEYILGALLLYFNFIVMLAMTLFITGILWWYKDIEEREQREMMKKANAMKSKDTY